MIWGYPIFGNIHIFNGFSTPKCWVCFGKAIFCDVAFWMRLRRLWSFSQLVTSFLGGSKTKSLRAPSGFMGNMCIYLMWYLAILQFFLTLLGYFLADRGYITNLHKQPLAVRRFAGRCGQSIHHLSSLVSENSIGFSSLAHGYKSLVVHFTIPAGLRVYNIKHN